MEIEQGGLTSKAEQHDRRWDLGCNGTSDPKLPVAMEHI